MPGESDRPQSLLVREYRPGEEARFLDLLNDSLREGGKDYTAEFWRWKHLENPFGASYGRYAWDEGRGRAAALRVLLRWRFRLPGGAEVAAVRAVDTATHSDYRRGGLFRKLTEAAVDDLRAERCSFIFNTPNAKSLPGYLKMGWQVVVRWPVYVRVLRPVSCLRAALRGGSPALDTSDPWDDCFGRGVLPWQGFSAAWGEEIDGVVTAWESGRRGVGLRTPRDSRFLAWRYGRHPSVRYGFVPVVEEGKLAAFAVLRPNRRFGLREVVLAELFARPGDPGTRRALLGEVLRQVRGDYCVAACSPGTIEEGMLRRALFLRVPRRGITLTARVVAGGPADPLTPSSWDLALGDLEVF